MRWLWPEANTGSTGGGEGLASIIAGDVPDVSAEFRSEFAALLAFYAARIVAARRSFSPSVAAAIVQSIINEQVVALRGLMERWHAAAQKQRDEKPERPMRRMQHWMMTGSRR